MYYYVIDKGAYKAYIASEVPQNGGTELTEEQYSAAINEITKNNEGDEEYA